jgi:DNA-binding FadR family transcriptional regulator
VLEAGDTPARVKQRTMALHAHQRLVEFIATRDAAGAEQFWQKHMVAVGAILSEFHGSKALVDLFA